MDCRASLAMTQSDDKSVVLWRCRRWRILVRHEGGGGSVPLRMEVDTRDIVCVYAYVSLGWVPGHGRHGGEAPALCVGTDDVGLDSFVLSYQEERTSVYSIVRI